MVINVLDKRNCLLYLQESVMKASVTSKNFDIRKIIFFELYILAAMPLYTLSRIVVVVVRVGVDHFIFTRKWLGRISSNFAYLLYCSNHVDRL